MKVVFEPKPSRTFALGVAFPVGWRHEMPKERGDLRRSLEEFSKSVFGFVPDWFVVEKIVEAEYSGIVIFGDVRYLKDPAIFVRNLVSAVPEWIFERCGGVDLVSISGALKGEVVDEIRSIEQAERVRYPKVVSRPRRFFALKYLSRIEKHFLVWIYSKIGGELFLEVSPRGDRIHYGSSIPNIEFGSLENSLGSYRLELLRRGESSIDAVKTLMIFNVFSKKTLSFEELLRFAERMDINNVIRAIGEMENIFRR